MNYKFEDFKHGQKFTATIDGVECEGRVSIEDGRIYFCQNEERGTNCRNKFGYKYSYIVFQDGTFYRTGFENLILYPPTETPRTLDDLQKGDVLISPGNREQVVLGVIDSLVFLDERNGYWIRMAEKEVLKEAGYTLKPTPPQNWEPKEGEDALFISVNRGEVVEIVFRNNSYWREYDLGLILPLTHRQQAQETLDKVMEVLAEGKAKI